MDDTAQGPGWWLASDGRWYAPERWTGPAPAYGPGSTLPADCQGAGNSYPSYGIGQHAREDAPIAPMATSLAIASLICSCAGVFFLHAVPGIIVGFAWLVLLALGIALGAGNTVSRGIISSMRAGPCCGAVGPES